MRLLACAVAALVALGAAPAMAETWTDTDRQGDVTRFFYSPKPPPCGTSKDARKPGNKKFDIARLSVNHRADAVVLEVGVRDLRPRQKFFLELNLRTSGRDYQVDVNRWISDEPVDVFLTDEPDYVEPNDCGAVGISSVGIPCEGALGEADAALDVIRLTLPRACIKRPEWVRAGAGLHGFKGRHVSFHDHWGRLSDVPGDNPWVNPLGPRVSVSEAP